MSPEVYAFAQGYNTIVNVLKTPIRVSQAFDPFSTRPVPIIKEFECIWDTGATNSSISKNVVTELGLKPIGVAEIHTAGGINQCNTYLVNFLLLNKVGITFLPVSGVDIGGADVLIGMDVISRGDFSITNRNNRTEFCFQIPSIGWMNPDQAIDIGKKKRQNNQSVEENKIIRPLQKRYPGVTRNAKCPCGSGKKHKMCCIDKPPL